MYRYELEITENGKSFFEDVWADNGRDAIEFGEMKYPYADFVELA
jgi:hypothetical protein